MIEAILACETLRDELNHALRITGKNLPIHWIESGLHNHPEKLRGRLQSEIDDMPGERILATFGLCGNSWIGIRTCQAELILPRVDDCISLLIGSVQERVKMTQGNGTYFLTKGWLKGERNIWAEYEYAVKKYGEEKAEIIMDMMMEHYKRLAILNTQSYEIETILPLTEHIAKTLKLEHEIIPASVEYLCRLLEGPWLDDKFWIIPPDTVIEHLQI